jgi:hypothetical protein
MADIFSVAGKSSGGAATVVCRCQLPLPWCYLTKLLCKNPNFRDFLRFSKFRAIKQQSEGILMILWVVVSSEVVHLPPWFDNPWVRTHRLREKQKPGQDFFPTPYIYIYIYNVYAYIIIYVAYMYIYVYIDI